MPAAVRGRMDAIVPAIEAITDRLARGGRLLYVGAGTAGRMGVLDASECPPTFGTPPELVQGIIAGGAGCDPRRAEGAEDDAAAGAAAMAVRARRGRRRRRASPRAAGRPTSSARSGRPGRGAR